MPETKPKKEEEKRPTWSMDIMILSNLNEIGKYIDAQAVDAEAGNPNALINWRAGLKQFYRNIQSFFTSDISKIVEDGIRELDQLIDPVMRRLPDNQNGLSKAYQLLDLLTEIFFQARNDLFMRFIVMTSPMQKAYEYTLKGLPKEEREQRIEEILKTRGEEQSESNTS